ncbi:MAG TPA: ATP-binding protein [Polyangiaceae bacterium]|nr:ATP-binding protein [Polyangiaceae bacterium]
MADVDMSAVGVSQARLPLALRGVLPALERSPDGIIICCRREHGRYATTYANATFREWVSQRLGSSEVSELNIEIELEDRRVPLDAFLERGADAELDTFEGFGWIVTRGAGGRCRVRVVRDNVDGECLATLHWRWPRVDLDGTRTELVLIEEAGLRPIASPSIRDVLGWGNPVQTGDGSDSPAAPGWGPLELAHPADIERVREVRAWLEHAPLGKAVSVLFRARHGSGEYRWLGGTARVAQGYFGHAWVWNLLDVSELKISQEELRGTRALLEQAQSVARIGTFRWALLNPGLMECSPEGERVLGVSSATELSASSFFSLCHDEDMPSVYAAFDKAGQEGGHFELECRLLGRDGTLRWVRVFGGVAYDSMTGQALELIGVLRDVSEQKRIFAQSFESQKMEALGRLAGSVAHDFNNMLSAIQGFARFIHDDAPDDSSVREDAAQILRASARAASLTQELLAFGRRQVLEPRVLDVREQIRDMEKMLTQLLPEHAKLRIVLSNDLNRVKVDPVKLEQVVLNLVLNAREAMPRGGTITIETSNVCLHDGYARSHVDLRPGNYVMLAVTDTGVGMTEEIRNRIFEPFFTTKEAGRGTGLGLATVFGIIKQSGGHVNVYSELGRGSVFKVYFPSCGEAPVREAPPTPISEAIALGETVLVVEDEGSVRELVQRILQRSGFGVLAAATPHEALELEESHRGRIDVLVTDVVMPGMSGHDLAVKLRRRRPELATVYMSGYTEHTVADQGVHLDGQWFVPKPIDPELLLGKVQEAARSLQREGRLRSEMPASGAVSLASPIGVTHELGLGKASA